MNATRSAPDHPLWQLPHGRARTLAPMVQQRWLRVHCGRLWATRTQRTTDPQAEDVWLAPSHLLRLEPGSQWVLEAVGDVRFSLLLGSGAARPALARRFWQYAAGLASGRA